MLGKCCWKAQHYISPSLKLLCNCRNFCVSGSIIPKWSPHKYTIFILPVFSQCKILIALQTALERCYCLIRKKEGTLEGPVTTGKKNHGYLCQSRVISPKQLGTIIYAKCIGNETFWLGPLFKGGILDPLYLMSNFLVPSMHPVVQAIC